MSKRKTEKAFDDALKLSAELLPVLEGKTVHIALNGLMFTMCELLINYSPDLEQAKKQLKELSKSCATTLELYDEENGPKWKRTIN